jgi:hypothetical protein
MDSKPKYRGCIVRRLINTGLAVGIILALTLSALLAAGCRGGGNDWWDEWSGSKYLAEAGGITLEPDPLVAGQLSALTITYDSTDFTQLISKDIVLDADARTLTVTVYARERDNIAGTWDGTLIVTTTFPDSGWWHLVAPRENGAAVGVDLFVEAPAGAPQEVIWDGDEYFPDMGDIQTDPDPLVANSFAHLTVSFIQGAATELISQRFEVVTGEHRLLLTVVARDILNAEASWDGTVEIPVTFLESGVWTLVVAQETGESTVDLVVQPDPSTPPEDVWMGDSYLPDVGDITTTPSPVTVNRLTHVTINFATTNYTELVSQEFALDPVARTLSLTVYARERAGTAAAWDGAVTVPATFLDRGVWQLIIAQGGGTQAVIDLYVYPEQDVWTGDTYTPNVGDVETDPDPVVINTLTHITVNFNTTAYTELVSQEWAVDAGAQTVTINVLARERADREADWDGTVTVPVTFLAAGAWTVIIPQDGGAPATVELYVATP